MRLQPCPFCGGSKLQLHENPPMDGSDEYAANVQCRTTGCCARTYWSHSRTARGARRAAVRRWNRRRPAGKLLGSGYLGLVHAGTLLCRKPPGRRCGRCVDRRSCRRVELREVKGGGG